MKCVGLAIEGECLTGKSSVLKKISSISPLPFLLIPEYFEIGTLSTQSRTDLVDVKHIQDELLTIERRRSDQVTNFLATHIHGSIGWDRSFLSLLAHEYALRNIGIIDGYEYLLEQLNRLICDNQLIIPAQVTLLTASSQTIEARRVKHTTLGHNDISPLLKDPLFRGFQVGYISKFGAKLYKHEFWEIPTDQLSITEVSQRCIAYLVPTTRRSTIDTNILKND